MGLTATRSTSGEALGRTPGSRTPDPGPRTPDPGPTPLVLTPPHWAVVTDPHPNTIIDDPDATSHVLTPGSLPPE